MALYLFVTVEPVGVGDEEVNINPDVNLARILTEYRLDTDNEYQEGAPIVVTGEKLMEYQI